LAQPLELYHQETKFLKQLNLTKMKKHLLFVALLFAFNIGKIFAQQHHHQNQQNHHYGGHHQSENHNNGGGGYNPNPNQQAVSLTMILKFMVQNPYKTQAIVDGNNYGAIQNLYDGITLTAGKHFVQLYKNGNRSAGGYMIFSGDVWLNANTITTASLNYTTGLVMNEILMYNNQCGVYPTYETHCNYAVDERTFCTFKNVVKNAWFDSDKQKMICDFLSRNYVNSNQVEQLLSMINFESTKLNIAKEAYTKVVDKNNYYTVFNQFDFESSKRELSDFMARC
jgi:hypothetical protein